MLIVSKGELPTVCRGFPYDNNLVIDVCRHLAVLWNYYTTYLMLAFQNHCDLPTLMIWAFNSRSHDLAYKSHGELENLEIDEHLQ